MQHPFDFFHLNTDTNKVEQATVEFYEIAAVHAFREDRTVIYLKSGKSFIINQPYGNFLLYMSRFRDEIKSANVV